MKNSIFFVLSIFCIGCSKIQPRKPINPKPSTTVLKEIIAESKALNLVEDQKIIELIKKDSLQEYFVSPSGFWYTYINKILQEAPTAKAGDEVEFSYSISNLQDSIIYKKEELGVKTYIVDKEDFISAIQSGIKLMKIGETITFVIPSYNAFGIAGDGNKISINQSIKSTVTLINIKE